MAHTIHIQNRSFRLNNNNVDIKVFVAYPIIFCFFSLYFAINIFYICSFNCFYFLNNILIMLFAMWYSCVPTITLNKTVQLKWRPWSVQGLKYRLGPKSNSEGDGTVDTYYILHRDHRIWQFAIAIVKPLRSLFVRNTCVYIYTDYRVPIIYFFLGKFCE